MINVRTAHMLAHYKQWADEQMFTSVASLPPGEATRERVTVFKNMVGCLNHIYVVDRIWQAHLEGREHEFKTRFEVPYPELDALQIAQTEINAWYPAWTAEQSDESLAEPINFTFVSGEKSMMTAGAMLMHVVNHAVYHRGWVVQMYFDVPAKPPMTDLPVFLGEFGEYTFV
jgi:uncharacterized damage-inducible protein DinB